MVTALYVTSTETFSGKTAVCIGLARRFLADGLRVGYFKPLSFTARQEECAAVDEDTQVIRRALGLKEPPETICPVLVTPRLMEIITRGEAGDLTGRIKAAYAKVAEGKDDDSAWFTSIQRITRTNMKDLEMSGDFRKY